MKKRVFAVTAITAAMAAACVPVFPAAADEAEADGEKKLSIVCTTFPQYDWARNVLGGQAENMDLKLLIDSGADLHNYQPTVEDIAAISSSDLFIYVGGESDGWVEDVLAEAVNPDMVTISLLESLGEGAKTEEIVEGMQDDHGHGGDEEEGHEEGEGETRDREEDGDGTRDHGHEGEETEDHGHEEDGDETHDRGSEVGEAEDHGRGQEEGEDGIRDQEGEDGHDHENPHEEGGEEYDEHVWLSLRNASVLTGVIADALGRLDPDHMDSYEDNAAAYREELKELDDRYAAVVEEADVDTLLFADRFPFRYLADDYGLDYYAAFTGCSAEAEASFETVIFLAGKVDELELGHICVIESADGTIAQTVISAAKGDPEMVRFDSLQSVTAKNVEEGVTYLSVMEENLEALREALAR